MNAYYLLVKSLNSYNNCFIELAPGHFFIDSRVSEGPVAKKFSMASKLTCSGSTLIGFRFEFRQSMSDPIKRDEIDLS